MTKYQVKDSGKKRKKYESGMEREVDDSKPDYLLCDLDMLERWAIHMTKGAKKYSKHNYQKACTPEELYRFQESAFRHFIQWLKGDNGEDHASAVIFGLAAAEQVKKKLKEKNGD